MGGTGLEQSALTPSKTPISKNTGTESGTVNDKNTQKHHELQKVIAAWPSLSEQVKKQILKIIKKDRYVQNS